MNRWLEKLGNASDSELPEVTKGGSGSFGSALTGTSEEKNASSNRWLAKLPQTSRQLNEVPPATLGEWLDWGEAHCPINVDDRAFLVERFQCLVPAELATTCRWYVQTWARAAAAEPKPYRRENAGRRAANRAVLRSQRP